ncbi:MAG TPA: DUF3168 domain-containing protein [Longimicrobium sp.]
MSARGVLQAAVAAQLRAEPGLAGVAVFDAPPVRGALPHAIVEEPTLSDWSTKSWVGAEARIAVTVRDEGERPVRLRALMAHAEEALGGLAGPVGGGWRVVRAVLVRSRVVKAKGDGWSGQAEFRVRMWREDG